MTRIDFYITRDTLNAARHPLACRIAEKAYNLGHQVYIHTESATQTRLMDDLLWTFHDESFVPHQSIESHSENPVPVLIGHHKEIDFEADVLINLTQDIPGFFSRFERVAELVNDDPDHKTQARDRYKFYRDRGYELNTHKL